MNVIYHLAPADYWHSQDPASPYLPSDFEGDGFIHCTRGSSLLLQVANTYYQDTPSEFLLLVIDENRVSAEIKYENGFRRIGTIRNIYSALDRNAIVAIHSMIRHDDGHFELPDAVV